MDNEIELLKRQRGLSRNEEEKAILTDKINNIIKSNKAEEDKNRKMSVIVIKDAPLRVDHSDSTYTSIDNNVRVEL